MIFTFIAVFFNEEKNLVNELSSCPMMGYTDCYFRLLAEKLYKSQITTFSEMIVDKAIIHNETKTINKHF